MIVQRASLWDGALAGVVILREWMHTTLEACRLPVMTTTQNLTETETLERAFDAPTTTHLATVARLDQLAADAGIEIDPLAEDDPIGDAYAMYCLKRGDQ